MLSSKEKKEITKLYDLTCKAFDKKLDHDVLALQVDDLADLPFEKIIQALHDYRINPKNNFWPKANQIRKIICLEIDHEAQASLIASEIRGGITLYGWSNQCAARAKLGEMAWQIVERLGGWNYICENHGVLLNSTAFFAQSRDLAKSLLATESANKFVGIEYKKNEVLNSSVIAALDFKMKSID
jgi:hypothetical protein